MDHPITVEPHGSVQNSFFKESGVRLLIAIPVHNEQKYVQAVLDKVRQFHDQILVVDDGSTDAPAQILASRADIAVIRHPKNQGYGRSLIDAFDLLPRRGLIGSSRWTATSSMSRR